jgi:hypothetical protein
VGWVTSALIALGNCGRRHSLYVLVGLAIKKVTLIVLLSLKRRLTIKYNQVDSERDWMPFNVGPLRK